MNKNDSKYVIPLSQRYRAFILAILVICTLTAYLARVGISVALPFISTDYGWNQAQQGNLGGILMGSFLIGYGISNFFLSAYIDVYGTKKVLLTSISIWSLAIFISAFYAHVYWVFLFSRVVLGLSQGVLYPTASKVVIGWFPPQERSRANSLYFMGGPLGLIVSPLLLTPIILRTSWEASFYFVALMGVLLLLPVILFIEDAPRGSTTYEKRRDPATAIKETIKTLISSRQFQILVFVFIMLNSSWWGISLWLPTYLLEAKGLSINEMTYGATIPYVGAILGMYVGSWISDITRHRKIIIVSGLISTTALLSILTLVQIQTSVVALILLFCVFFVSQMASPIFFTILQGRVKEELMGSATGIMNGIGNGVGIIGPLSIGFIVAVTGSYDLGLLFIGVLTLLGGIILQLLYLETRDPPTF